MKLNEYLQNIKWLVKSWEFAHRLGISPTYLSRIANRHKRASIDLAKRIEKETKGAVTWTEVIDE